MVLTPHTDHSGFPGSTMAKHPPAKAEDTRDSDLISGSERSPGVGSGNPLQLSCLGNSMDKGAGRLRSLGPERVSGRTEAPEHAHTRFLNKRFSHLSFLYKWKSALEAWLNSGSTPVSQCFPGDSVAPTTVSHQKDQTAPAYSAVSDKDVGSGGVG